MKNLPRRSLTNAFYAVRTDQIVEEHENSLRELSIGFINQSLFIIVFTCAISLLYSFS